MMNGSLNIILIPEALLLLTAFVLLGVDYGFKKGLTSMQRRLRMETIALIGITGAVLFQLGLVIPNQSGENRAWAHGMWTLNPVIGFLKALIFSLASLVIGLSRRTLKTNHIGEYYALILLGALGMGVLVSTHNLLMAFIGLETMGLSLYALVALQRGKQAIEAAYKYFVFGSVAAAFLAFGFTYLYGVAHSLDYAVIHQQLVASNTLSPLIRVAFIFVIAGLMFKIASAPLHFWAPDVYETSPGPVAGWIAGASKIASLYLLCQMALLFNGTAMSSHTTTLAWVSLSAASLLIGNLGALRQSNLKRLMAYSSIAHAGYILIGVQTSHGAVSLIYYSLVYSFATLGAIAWIDWATEAQGRRCELSSIRGLIRRSPLSAIYIAVFILSLAGVPPLGGFFGKYYLFAAGVAGSHFGELPWILLALALVMSTVAVFYYLKILKAVWVEEDDGRPIQFMDYTEHIAFGTLSLGLIVLGLFPGRIVDFFSSLLY